MFSCIVNIVGAVGVCMLCVYSVQYTQLGTWGRQCTHYTLYNFNCSVHSWGGGGLYDLYCILYTLYSFNCIVHIWGAGGLYDVNSKLYTLQCTQLGWWWSRVHKSALD